MTPSLSVENPHCTMPPEVENAYSRVHSWLDALGEHKKYIECTWASDGAKAVAKDSPEHAAFYFDSLFPTHFFKAYHALRSQDANAAGQILQWLRFNPNLAVLDLGCGDGAGSCAVIAALLDFRAQQLLDPRPLQVHIVGVDVDRYGLDIFQKVMSALATEVAKAEIHITFDPLWERLNDASSEIETLLNNLRRSWGHPYLARLLSVESNLNDYLEREYRIGQLIMKALGKTAKPQTRSDYGLQLASFYRQLLEMTPVDQVLVVTIDTKPNEMTSIIQTRLKTLETRLFESGHSFRFAPPTESKISFTNPRDCYWRKRKGLATCSDIPFVVSTCALGHHDQALDSVWNRITDVENLELAWARARRELLGGALSDEVEIRLFEHDLSSSLERMHAQLDLYAIQAGYIPDTLRYAIPKSDGKARPHGLDWLENELMLVAIIQVAGVAVLEQRSYSFAYRLSQENNDDNGPTEHLYERWSNAWKDFQREAGNYAKVYPLGVVFSTDISKFFERIVQDQVSELVREGLHVGSKRIQWLVSRLVEKNVADHDPGKGLVQGSVGSGFFANLYLSPLDTYIRSNDEKQRRLFRYVDDIYVVIPNPADRDQTEVRINEILTARLELAPNRDKTTTYTVEHFLKAIAPDAALDQFQDRFERLMAQLRRLNGELRAYFRTAWGNDQVWWMSIEQLRSCMTELGLYVTTTQLGRAVQRACVENEGADDLEFPSLPEFGTINQNFAWAADFRLRNPQWATDLSELKSGLELLFTASTTDLESIPEDIDKNVRRSIERRLRFAANRLGLLGLDQVHDRLRELLCHRPDVLRSPRRLLDDLARQAYDSDVQEVLNFHSTTTSEIAPYMRAIAVRALRLLPRLEGNLWRQLVLLMFTGDEITRLMATETWLHLASKHSLTPLKAMVRKEVIACLQAPLGVSRRLLKNYVLVLGVVDHGALLDLPVDQDADPILILAHHMASQGKVSELFASVEPELLRRKYYSSRYDDYDGDGGPY